jgi:putative membrane protein
MNFSQRVAFVLFAAVLIPPSSGRAAETSSEDADVVGVLAAANQGELDAADLALKSARDEAVKKFARHMKHDHADAKKKLAALGIKPSSSLRSAALKTEAAEEAVKLKLSPSDKFDRVYMDAQVADHEGLLKALDEELIAKAGAPELAKLLVKIRETVAAHLEEARGIKLNLDR